jgi:uncharacterized protein YjbJ (UPF0337 family)
MLEGFVVRPSCESAGQKPGCFDIHCEMQSFFDCYSQLQLGAIVSISLTHFTAFTFLVLFVLLFTGEPSKVTGHKDEVIGSVKSSVGGLLHNNEMKAKGDAQHASGTTEVNAAAAKQKADAAVEGGKGNIKSVIGSLTGNDKMVSFQALQN